MYVFQNNIWSYLFIILFLSVPACKDSSVNNTDDSSLSSVYGIVSNWNLGDSLNAVAISIYDDGGPEGTEYVLGYCSVTRYGEFSFKLPTPPSMILHTGTPGFSYSDTSARFTGFSFRLRDPNRSYFRQSIYNASVPNSVYYSDSARTGEYYAYLMYADRDVIMSGVSKGISDAGSPDRADTTIINYDVHFKKGWNRIVGVLVSRTLRNRIIQISVNNLNDGNWYKE